ncbi:hypothetical protein Tco_0212994 [Tanacetum coccineum]
MNKNPYEHSAVGSIMYAVRCTRPDLRSRQNITSQFQQNPGDAHWTAVKNILKYLRNTKDMFLVYHEGGVDEGYGWGGFGFLFGLEVVLFTMKEPNKYVLMIILSHSNLAKNHGVTKGATEILCVKVHDPLRETIEMG